MASNWEDASRLEAWAGEIRVNLIRAVALVVFYANHLLNVYVWPDKGTDPEKLMLFHARLTVVVLAWGLGILILHTCLARRWMPPAMKYVSTLWDLLLLSTLIMLSPDGPRSPLMVLFFLVIASAPLRLSLPLVYVATLGAMAGAALVLGHWVFLKVGYENYYHPAGSIVKTADGPSVYPAGSAVNTPDGQTVYLGPVSRVSELIFLLALGTAGLLAGQVVRQARRLVEGYPVRVEEPRDKEAA